MDGTCWSTDETLDDSLHGCCRMRSKRVKGGTLAVAVEQLLALITHLAFSLAASCF